MEPVEVRGYVVEFIGVEIAVDVRGDSGRGVPHRFLDVAKVGTGGPGQAGVCVPEVMDRERRQLGFRLNATRAHKRVARERSRSAG